MPAILQVVLDLAGWEPFVDPADKTAKWQSVTSDELRLTCTPRPADLPDLADIAAVRRFYKQALSGRSAALISCDTVTTNGTRAVRTVFKRPAGRAQAMSFGAYLNAPVSEWMIELGIAGSEGHFTGTREAVILQELVKRASLSERRQLAVHEMPLEWKFERYEPGTRGAWAYLVSDDEKYDAAWPDHPLSRVRRWLRRVERSFSISLLETPTAQGTPPLQVVCQPVPLTPMSVDEITRELGPQVTIDTVLMEGVKRADGMKDVRLPLSERQKQCTQRMEADLAKVAKAHAEQQGAVRRHSQN